MKILGIVTEYNPFHNGHLYQLTESKKATGCEGVICVMSGNFVQRGEPAIINKWARAKAALMNGIDLVIELPAVYAVSSAESFGFGAVSILDATGVVEYISFGSESGSIGQLQTAANILYDEPAEFKNILKNYVNQGLAFPRAREYALKEYLSKAISSESHISNILSSANNILAIEYLKAMKKLDSAMRPFTIKRISNRYMDPNLTGAISSATSVRRLIIETITAGNDISDDRITSVLPQSSVEVVKSEIEAGRGPVTGKSFEGIILSCLRKMNVEKIAEIPGVEEGLENRIAENAGKAGSLAELTEGVLTKRYPMTKINRILFNLLTGISKKDNEMFSKAGGPQYIRVLGFNSKGRKILSELKSTAKLPIITKTADYKDSSNKKIRRMLEIEASSTDQYVLGYQNTSYRYSGQEFSSPIIRI